MGSTRGETMKHLQSWMKDAYDYSCLAQCYLYAVADHSKIKLTEKQTEMYIMGGLLNGYGLGKDFFVKDPVHLMKQSWKDFCDEDIHPSVKKMDLPNGLKDLKTIEYAAVRYDYSGHSHFILMKYGLLEYNGLEGSQCFKYGKPTSARIIEFK